MTRVTAATAALLSLFVAADAAAWCRMTTSRRRPSAAEPCVLPRDDTDPPEQFLFWQQRCHSWAVSVGAPSRDLTEEQVRAIVGRSLETWSTVDCSGTALGFDLILLDEPSTCAAPLYRDGGGNVNTVMFTTDWAEFEYDANAFAVTTVWHRISTGEIFDADMHINERRGPYGICPEEGCDESSRTVDLENVVTHEVGHFMGLAHSQDMQATMYASAVAGETIKRTLGADDVEGICTVYPPETDLGECDYTPRGGLDLDCEPGCGCSAPGPQRGLPLGVVLGLVGVGAVILRRR